MITSAIAASAHVEMGRERFAEAKKVVAQGLTLDPTITELLELRQVIEQSIKQP